MPQCVFQNSEVVILSLSGALTSMTPTATHPDYSV